MGKYRTSMANILNGMAEKEQQDLEKLTGEAIGDLMENYNQRSYKDGPGSLDGAFTSQQLQKLKGTWARKSTKDVTPGIMKMIKGWDIATKNAVATANINVISKITAKEEVEFTESIEEGRMKDIHTMDSEGKTANEIAKALGIKPSIVKGILGEDLDETVMMSEKFSADQIARLKKSYEVMRGKRISTDNANKLSAMFKTIPDDGLVDIFKADIPFLSVMAMTKMIQKNIPRPAGVKLSLEAADIPKKNVKDVEDVDQGGDIQDPKPETVKKDKSAVVEKEGEGDVAKKDAEIVLLKKKMETEKAKAVQKMTQKQVNPETGEPLLQIGVAYKALRDKMKKEEIEEELQITEGKIDAKKFDTLKKGDTMTITYNSTMSGTTVKKFVVKNKTRSAKYNTDKVKLEIDGMPGRSPFYLYKRKDGSVSFAQGDMAATVVAVKEDTSKYTSQQIKMAYGVANDKRYKGGNYSGAVSAIEKIAKGLSLHPDVQNVLKRTNEDTILEFKKMTVSFPTHDSMSKASTDLAKKGFTITGTQKALKIDGKGEDLNKYATDLKNFYGATIKAETYEAVDRFKQTSPSITKEGTLKLEASLYAFKEYEPSQSYEASRDMKNVEDAIKRAGGRIKSKEKPTRREPNASFEIETGNPNAVKAAIKKADPEFNVD